MLDQQRSYAVQMRRAYSVMCVTTLAMTFELLTASAVNVALPAMSHSFDVDATTANWFLIAFMLALTSTILVSGRLSDMVGRKRIYLGGLVAFTILSLLSAFAPTAEIMIAVRTVQGVASATLVANAAAILADVFPPHRLGYALGLNLTAASVAYALGPLVGGLLIAAFGWPAIFLFGVPFGIAGIILGAKIIPNDRRDPQRVRERFDYAGAALSASGLVFLLYGVNEIASVGMGSPVVLVSMCLGVLLLSAFVVVELRVKHPLVDLALVNTFARWCAYGSAFFNSIVRAGVTVLVVLHQQIVYGSSAFEAGLVVMSMAAAMMIGSPLAGRLITVMTPRALSAIGATLVLVGVVGLILTTGDHALAAEISWLVLVGLGIGFFTAPNSTAVLSGVAPGRRAMANSIRSMLYNSAQAIGTAVSLLIITSSGVVSYAVQTNDPQVQSGFQFAYLMLTVAAVITLVLCVSRGGAWMARNPRETSQ